MLYIVCKNILNTIYSMFNIKDSTALQDDTTEESDKNNRNTW